MPTKQLKLPPNTDLRDSIHDFASKEQISGFVAGVVGNLSKASFQCPGPKQVTVMEGVLEIITLNGTFSPSGCHLHLSFSDNACKVWGGHLERGTIVLKGADILLNIVDKNAELAKVPSTSSNNVSSKLEIAVMPNCPWSARSLRILQSNKIPFSLIQVDNDDVFLSVKSKSGHSTFPQFFKDDKFIGGYEVLKSIINDA